MYRFLLFWFILHVSFRVRRSNEIMENINRSSGQVLIAGVALEPETHLQLKKV